MAPGKAIVVSTHILEEVEAVCTRAVIIANGRIVADETPQALKARSALHNAVGLTLAAEAVARARTLIEALPGIAGVETLSRVDGVAELRVLSAGGANILAPVREALQVPDAVPADVVHDQVPVAETAPPEGTRVPVKVQSPSAPPAVPMLALPDAATVPLPLSGAVTETLPFDTVKATPPETGNGGNWRSKGKAVPR